MAIKAFLHHRHVAILRKLRERWIFVAVPSWSLSLWLFLSILTTNWLAEFGLAATALIVLLKVLLFLLPLFIRSATKRQWMILLVFADITIFSIISSYVWYWDRGMPIAEHTIGEMLSLIGNAFLFTIILFPLLLVEGINNFLPFVGRVFPYLTGVVAIYWILIMLVVLYGTKASRKTQLTLGVILLIGIVLTILGSRAINELL